MAALRGLSARPEVLVGPSSVPGDPATGGQIGVAGPLGRGRMVRGVPTNKTGPVQLQAPLLLCDNGGNLFGDPSSVVLGTQGVWVHRMLYATRTIDTRRL
jgi:hypothetical protein